MPTSSQALILLSTDGRLPPKVPRQTFPVNCVPYPTRNIDINATCVEYDDTPDEYSGDVTVSRHKRIRVGDILDSLPELLTIRGYHGSLAYDVNSKVLRWKVDTELPKSKMEAFLSYRGDSDLKPDYYHEPRVRFPSICGEEPKRNGQFSNIENTYGYTHRYGSPPSVENKTLNVDSPRSENGITRKKSVSFPQLFKTTIDADTYKRLYDLGFRQQHQPKNNKTQKQNTENKDERKRVKLQAWESPEDYKDKDFRLEDLDLNTGHTKTGNSSHDLETKNLPQNVSFHPTNVSLSRYMSERKHFFNKYGDVLSDMVTHGGPTDHVTAPPESRGHVMVSKEPSDHAMPPGEYRDYVDGKTSHVSLLEKEPDKCQHVIRQQINDDSAAHHTYPTKYQLHNHLSLLDNVASMANYNKWKKQKLTTVRLRRELPVQQPLSVCFSLLDNAKSHSEVKDLVESQVGCTVTKLQFDPISVHTLDNQAKSRWVVTFKDKESADFLVSSGLIVDGSKMEVRQLDEALKEEVDAYRLYQMVQRGQVKMPSYNESQRRRRRDRNGTRST